MSIVRTLKKLLGLLRRWNWEIQKGGGQDNLVPSGFELWSNCRGLTWAYLLSISVLIWKMQIIKAPISLYCRKVSTGWMEAIMVPWHYQSTLLVLWNKEPKAVISVWSSTYRWNPDKSHRILWKQKLLGRGRRLRKPKNMGEIWIAEEIQAGIPGNSNKDQ